MRGPSYLCLTRSILWLLVPWLLTSPGHQQPWYWLCRIGRFLSYLRKVSSTCIASMWRNYTKCKYMFMFPLKNLARKGLRPLISKDSRYTLHSLPIEVRYNMSFVSLKYDLRYIPSASTTSKGLYWFHLICPSVHPYVDIIMSILYILQY